MLIRFLRHSVVYALSAILTRGIGLILLPLYTRALPPAAFGLLDYITVLGAFVGVTVALEITQGVARALPEHRDDPVEFRTIASTALWFAFAAYTAFVLAVVFGRKFLAEWLFSDQIAVFPVGDILPLAAATFAVNGLVGVMQNQLRWELRPLACTLLSAGQAMTTLLATGFVLLQPEPSVRGVFAAQFSAGAITLAVAGWVIRGSYTLRFSGSRLAEMLAFSFPLVLSSVGVMLSNYVDRLAIRELMSLEAVGIYGVAYRVAMIVSLLMVGFQGALTPLVYSHHREASTPGHLATLFRVFWGLALLGFGALSLADGWIIELVAPAGYGQAADVLPWLVLAALFGGMYIFAPGLGLARKTAWVAGFNVGGAALNLLLNVLLIPVMGIAGAALATCISAASVFMLYMVFSQRHYPVSHDWKRLLGAIAVTLLITFAGRMAPLDSTAGCAWRVLALFGVGLSVIGFGILRRQEIVRGLALLLSAFSRQRQGRTPA